tara:strand:- start:767 stop:910 length:144 start_codon:yes stop_codon:yes gene_type:complete
MINLKIIVNTIAMIRNGGGYITHDLGEQQIRILLCIGHPKFYGEFKQ